MVNRKFQVWLPLLFALVLVLGMMLGYNLRDKVNMPGFFRVTSHNPLQEVLDLVEMKYVDEVTLDTLADKAIEELLSGLDPHSVYIPASDVMQLNDDLRGNFSGIGVEFQMFYDTVNVVNVIPKGPSEKAGLQVGDKILRVNDTVQLAGRKLEPNDIRNLLRGRHGSNVTVTVLRDKRQIPFTIQRGTIPVPSVNASYKINSNTGFIHINRFAESTYFEFMDAMKQLQSSNLQNLIVDLRGNGGGLLNQAVFIADEFLSGDKLIVYTEGNHVPKTEYKCKKEGVFEKGNLVLLVDETSASASEVLSGALQDWDRATVVGRRTFGKGLVQEQFSLTNGAAVRLTVARYFTPLGRNIQKSYTAGTSEYEQEVTERFHSGEVLSGDSSKNNGKAYTTQSGKTVYGGGGISPDIYVAFDTAALSREVTQLYTKGTLSNFVYTYYIQHKNELSTISQPSELSQGFSTAPQTWDALKTFAAKDSINLNNLTVRDKAHLQKRIPQLLARQIWRYDGYYKVMNQTDDFVHKALQVLQTGN